MDILNFTQAMSNSRRNRIGHFEWNEMAYWRQGVMSPLFYRGGKLPSKRDLDLLVRRWRKPKYKSPANSTVPYFNVLDQKLSKRHIRNLASWGWKLQPRLLTFNCFDKLMKAKIPDDIQIEVSTTKNRRALNEYLEANQEAFKFSNQWMLLIKKCIQTLPAGKIVLLKNKKGAVIGGGSVFHSGEFAYCFGGFVKNRYRGRGLWRVMMSVRQSVSAADGVRYWCYVTSNERIRDKGTILKKTQYFLLEK